VGNGSGAKGWAKHTLEWLLKKPYYEGTKQGKKNSEGKEGRKGGGKWRKSQEKIKASKEG